MREGLGKIPGRDDTIVAVSTPNGRSAIGVVRLSGAACRRIADSFFERAGHLSPRHATHGKWRDAQGEPVDDVVVTFYPGTTSYTGEDLLEVSAHGNPLVLNRIVQLAWQEGARAAQPGEFTLRAVMHGKLDLLQAEAVRDFIEAQTVQQARVARLQMDGGLSRRIEPIKGGLVDLIAHIEASIDFSDDDVEPPNSALLSARAEGLADQLEKLQASYNYGRLLLEGANVVIAGRPNVGKSSLFNALLAMDRAIVTDIPGTTRDVLSEKVDLDGIPLRLLDTAGLHETSDEVEKIGVTRTREALAEADLTLVVVDGSEALEPEDKEILRETAGTGRIIVWNKCDLGVAASAAILDGSPQLRVSARTGHGLTELLAALRAYFLARPGDEAGDSVLTHARHHEAVIRARDAMAAAAAALAAEVPHEMVALDLYTALGALNELTGDTVTDDILGRIFASFCVGK